MVKSRAEIQKAYRERLKAKLGEEYNKRERERVRKNYVPAEVLSSAKLKERNRKNKIRNRLSIQRQKEKLRGLVEHESTDDETSGYASNIADLFRRIFFCRHTILLFSASWNHIRCREFPSNQLLIARKFSAMDC